jgi:PAS domain S-box-containing protein
LRCSFFLNALIISGPVTGSKGFCGRVSVTKAWNVVGMARGRSRLPPGIGKFLILGILSFSLPLYLTLIAVNLVSEKERAGLEAEFAALALESEKALLHRVDSYHQAMLGAGGLFQASDEVSHEEWRHYVQALGIAENLPGIGGIGYAVSVDPQNLAEFVARMRRNGAPDFAVHPQTEGLPYFVLAYVAPLKGNERVVGLNLAFEANRRQAAILARDTGKAAITRRILLLQDQTRSQGFALLHPVYRLGIPQDTPELRRAAFIGWIYAPFVGTNLLSNLTQSQGTLLDIRVHDGEDTSEDALIYGSMPDVEEATEPSFTLRRQIKVMQQTWTLVWTSTARFEEQQASSAPLGVLLAGVLFSIGIAAFVLFFARRTATVERRVVEKTREIAASEEQMKLLIRHTPAAVAMFDRNMRYIMTSERWLQDYKLGGRDIIGRSHYEVFPELESLPHRTEAHRRALSGESLSNAEDAWQRADGRTEWVKWAMHPWIDSDGQIGGIVTFTEVITERKQAEQRSDLIREMSIEASEAASTQDILGLALGKICAFLRWPVARSYFWSRDKAFADAIEIWHREPWAPADDDRCDSREMATFAFESRLQGRVIAERRPVFVERLDQPEGSGCPRLPWEFQCSFASAWPLCLSFTPRVSWAKTRCC